VLAMLTEVTTHNGNIRFRLTDIANPKRHLQPDRVGVTENTAERLLYRLHGLGMIRALRNRLQDLAIK
jgi:hypothetical protein